MPQQHTAWVLVNTGQFQWQMASAQVTAVMIRNASEAYPPSELSDQWGLPIRNEESAYPDEHLEK